MPTVKIEGVGDVKIYAEPGTPKFDAAIDEIRQSHGGFSQPKRSVSKQAKQNQLGMQQREARAQSASAADAESHLKNALWMTKTAATMAPFALAAPFTGGTSLGVGAAIMGGAGLASGATREVIDKVQGQDKSWGEVTKNLVWDTAFGAGTEIGLRPLAAIGGEFLNAQLLRSAQKSQAGKALVEGLETQAHQAIEGIVKVRGAVADVRGVYSSFINKLAALPRGSDPVGKAILKEPAGQIGQIAAKAREALASVDATGVSAITQKPLNELIAMHSELNQIVHSTTAPIRGAAKKAAREFADDIRGVIAKSMTPEERSLFEGAKEITKQKLGLYAGQNLASQVVKRLVGGTVGTAVGLATGSVSTGIKVAAVTEAVETKFAPIILEHLANAEKLPFQKAINAILKNPDKAESLIKQLAVGLGKSIPTEFSQAIRSEARSAAENAKEKVGSVVNRASGD